MRYLYHELKGEDGKKEKELNELDRVENIKKEADEFNDAIDGTGV